MVRSAIRLPKGFSIFYGVVRYQFVEGKWRPHLSSLEPLVNILTSLLKFGYLAGNRLEIMLECREKGLQVLQQSEASLRGSISLYHDPPNISWDEHHARTST